MDVRRAEVTTDRLMIERPSLETIWSPDAPGECQLRFRRDILQVLVPEYHDLPLRHEQCEFVKAILREPG